MICCPTHRTKENFSFHLKDKYNKYGLIRACKCEKCKMIYINVNELPHGNLYKYDSEYEIYNLYNYHKPKELYLISNYLFQLKSSSFNVDQLKEFSYDGEICNATIAYDKKSKKYYMSESTYRNMLSKIVDLEIKVISEMEYVKYKHSKKVQQLPNKLYILEKENIKELSKEVNLITVTEFINNKSLYHIPTRYDKSNDKYYISQSGYQNYMDLIKSLHINAIDYDSQMLKNMDEYNNTIDEIYVADKDKYEIITKNKYLSKVKRIVLDNKCYRVTGIYDVENYRLYISEDMHNQIEMLNDLGVKIVQDLDENENSDDLYKSIDFNNLKKNNKIAVAYKTANITYNPYQYLPWLYLYNEKNKNILISDEVGLGKTIEAGILITEELHEHTNNNILVVCPAFLKK